MAELTDEQRAFLAAHGIPLGLVFDATGMRKPAYQEDMREMGKSFAYGVTPCLKGGHTLRTRAGHCIQCDTAKIAYMLRYDAPANVYIAGSRLGRLIKVGSTTSVTQRRTMLCAYSYGDQFDWQMLATANTPAAGRVEFEAQAMLTRYSVAGSYSQGGRRRSCNELFRCNFEDAREAVCTALPEGVELQLKSVLAETDFNFRD